MKESLKIFSQSDCITDTLISTCLRWLLNKRQQMIKSYLMERLQPKNIGLSSENCLPGFWTILAKGALFLSIENCGVFGKNKDCWIYKNT